MPSCKLFTPQIFKYAAVLTSYQHSVYDDDWLNEDLNEDFYFEIVEQEGWQLPQEIADFQMDIEDRELAAADGKKDLPDMAGWLRIWS